MKQGMLKNKHIHFLHTISIAVLLRDTPKKWTFSKVRSSSDVINYTKRITNVNYARQKIQVYFLPSQMYLLRVLLGQVGF